MATITEDYCSYEVAQLLKEKGFDEICYLGYNKNGEYVPTSNRTNSQIIQPDYCFVCCSTLQMAMKWLRKKHNIMASPYALSLGYYFEIFDLTNRDITGCKPLYKVGIPNKEDVLSTYEAACETAIKFCLENLI